jgi:geranylgeranyl diphosphate synthase, type II
VKNYHPFVQLFENRLSLYRAGLVNREPKELYAPCEYILSLGGKRVRPLLALLACDLFDKEPSMAVDSALAVELFHNFSLIHDDILDKAPLRRNKPTVHTKWNHNIAILSGDVMLVEASRILETYPANVYKKLTQLFNLTATQVCEGQQMDMNFESSFNITTKEYIQMITLKTAVLLGCSLQMGAINSGVSASYQKHIYTFGKDLGIAFQLLDDYLDTFATNKKDFGKQIGGDIIANKKTFLLLKAFELASSSQKKELKRLLKLTKKDEKLKVRAVTKIFEELGVGKLCIKEADAYTHSAIAALNTINASETKKKALSEFAHSLLKRQF